MSSSLTKKEAELEDSKMKVKNILKEMLQKRATNGKSVSKLLRRTVMKTLSIY